MLEWQDHMPGCFVHLSAAMVTLAVAAIPLASQADTIQWTNVSGGDWRDATNWSPNVVPTSADVAVITNDGTYNVNVLINPVISGLIIGASSGTQTVSKTTSSFLTVNGPASIGAQGQLNVSAGMFSVAGAMTVEGSVVLSLGGSLTVNAPASVEEQGQLNMSSGGVLSAAGGLTLHGIMTWSRGVFSASTLFTVASNGVLTVQGSASKSLHGAAITNAGLISLVGTTGISGSGKLYNLQGGVFEIQTDADFSGFRLVNDGNLRKSGGLATTTLTATEFLNNGTIAASTGAIFLNGVTIAEGSSYVGAGTIILSSGTMNGSFTSENLVLNAFGPGVTGTGTLHGSMTWPGGTLGAGAVLTVATNASLLLDVGSTKTLSGTITNSGTIGLAGDRLSLASSGSLHIQPGGVLELQDNSDVFGGLTINDGLIRKSVGLGTASISSLPCVNNGVVEAQVGTIRISGSLGGSVDAVLGDGSSYIGAGTIIVGDNVALAGSFISQNLTGGGSAVYLEGNGTLHGSASFPVNLIVGPTASLTVATNSRLELSTTFDIHGSVTNAGTIASAISLRILDGTLHNHDTGLIDLTGDYTLNASGSALLLNDGIFRKSAGPGTNTISASLPFVNNGTILAQSGTLLFSGSLTNTVGTLAVMGGKIGSQTPWTLLGGLVTGSGTLEAPAITSSAVFSPGSTNAVLILSGNYTQQLGGSLEFDIGGVDAGTNQSKVIVTGDAHLNGSIRLRFSPAYSPAIGVSNTVFEAASLGGGFKCFNGFLLLGEDKRLNLSYSSTNLILTAIAAPDPPAPSLTIAKELQSLICWPSEFVGYDLYFSTNSDVGNWTALPGASNPHLEEALESQKYFKLVKQP